MSDIDRSSILPYAGIFGVKYATSILYRNSWANFNVPSSGEVSLKPCMSTIGKRKGAAKIYSLLNIASQTSREKERTHPKSSATSNRQGCQAFIALSTLHSKVESSIAGCVLSYTP